MNSDTFWTAGITSMAGGIHFESVGIALVGFIVVGVVQPFFRVFWSKLLYKHFPPNKKKKNRRKKS